MLNDVLNENVSPSNVTPDIANVENGSLVTAEYQPEQSIVTSVNPDTS